MHAGAVNYGTNLIPSCLASSDRKLGDVIVTSVLLKQVALMLDALGVLVREACADASILQARALFEASLFLEWMLTDDQEKKALYYYVADVRKERQWVKRGVTDDPEQAQFFRNLGEFSNALEPTRQELSEFAPDRLREIDEFLTKEPYASISREYETIRRNRPFEPAWYAPLGETSVRSEGTESRVAKHMGVGFLYKYGYGYASMHVHPMASDGEQDLSTIAGLAASQEFPSQVAVLSNSVLAVTLLLQDALNFSSFRWRRELWTYCEQMLSCWTTKIPPMAERFYLWPRCLRTESCVSQCLVEQMSPNIAPEPTG